MENDFIMFNNQAQGFSYSAFPNQLQNGFASYDQSMSTFNPENKNNKNVRHSDVEFGFQPVFTPFTELPLLTDNIDVQALLFHIKTNFENSEWLSRFNAVNEVRSFYKSMPHQVNDILECFGKSLVETLKDSKSCVIKITIYALHDIYEHTSQFPVDFKFTSTFLNFLVNKATVQNQNISKIVEVTLEAMINNCCCDFLIQQLCEVATNQNKHVSSCGFENLVKALSNIQGNVEKLNELTTKMIFKTLSYIFLGKKIMGNSKNSAKKLIKFYLTKMSEDGFKRFLMHMVEGSLLSKEEALKLHEMAMKEEIIQYPKVSTFVEQMRVSCWNTQSKQTSLC